MKRSRPLNHADNKDKTSLFPVENKKEPLFKNSDDTQDVYAGTKITYGFDGAIKPLGKKVEPLPETAPEVPIAARKEKKKEEPKKKEKVKTDKKQESSSGSSEEIQWITGMVSPATPVINSMYEMHKNDMTKKAREDNDFRDKNVFGFL